MQVAYKVADAGPLGKGLFAEENIPAGTLIWKYEEGKSVRVWTKDTILKRIDGLSKEDAAFVLEHMYPWNGAAIEILGDAHYWNHGSKPNTGENAEDPLSSYAIRDIKKGEQLLDDYGAYDYENTPWFKKLCGKFGIVHYDESWE